MDSKQMSFPFVGATGSTEKYELPKGLNGPAGPRNEDAFDPPKDEVSNPAHYTMGSIEVFDFIKAWDLNFAEGNVVKYLVRSPYKGSKLKDLKKARWYLDQLIEDAEHDV
jgi:hypothetical protein